MRRALILVPLILLGILAFLVLSGGFDDTAETTNGPDAGPTAADPADEDERERVRANEKDPGRERILRGAGNAFQRQFPEVGQDLPQDPALGSISGRVMITKRKPAAGGVLEASVGGKLIARIHVPGDGSFNLKNVKPGVGYALVARLDGHAPGGLDRIGVQSGAPMQVGTVYVGAPIGPNVDNHVRAVVLDESGAPIAGAEVTATTVFYGALLSLGQMEKQPGGTIVRQVTNADGEALFEMLPPAAYDLFATAPGYSFEVRQRLTIQGDTKARYELKLRPGLSISGIVVDQEDQPIAHARVGGLRWNEFTSVPAVESDEEGKFSLDGLRPGQPYFLFALKADIGGKELQNIEAGTSDLVIKIELGGDVTLKVTDAASGDPISDFTLRPFRTMPFAYMYAPMIEAQPDEKGEFTFRISAADYGMEISADGYAMETLPKVTIPSPDVVEVALAPAGVVTGRVVSKSTGEPVVGADVFVKKGGFPPSRVKDLTTVTSTDGTFTLDRLPPRTLSLWISHVDHTEALFEGIEPRVASTDAAAADGGAPEVQEFRLGSGGRIEGRVFGDDHLPAVGKTMVLSAGFDFMSARNAMTDANGRSVFKNVPLGKQYTVSVGVWSAGRVGASKSGVSVSEGTTTTVDFGDETGGVAVSGVVMRSGAPVPNAAISLVSDDGGDAVVQERTDDLGRFTFQSVQEGKYQITVNRRGNVSTELVVGTEPVTEFKIELPTARVTGIVVDAATGAPVGGVYVECERVAQGGASNISRLTQSWGGNDVTNDDGVFDIGSLNDATYRVRATRDGYGTVIGDDFAINDGASVEGLRLRLGAACTVTGFVRDSAGTPLSGASLTILDQKGRRQSLVDMNTSSSDGTYAASQLAPGTYTMTFRKDGFAPASQVVNVTPGAVLETDFTMLQGGKIEVTVKGAEDKPVKGAVVVLLDAQGNPIEESFTMENLFSTATLKTDAKGHVTLAGLAPGTYRLLVEKKSATTRSDAVEVFEGGQSSVDIVTSWSTAE
jgi:protocatechuate 3,4-dioxygenase beta subunit